MSQAVTEFDRYFALKHVVLLVAHFTNSLHRVELVSITPGTCSDGSNEYVVVLDVETDAFIHNYFDCGDTDDDHKLVLFVYRPNKRGLITIHAIDLIDRFKEELTAISTAIQDAFDTLPKCLFPDRNLNIGQDGASRPSNTETSKGVAS